MEKKSRKERERIARRENIIDAAEVVISENGYDASTMDEISEKAEVGKGTLYLHFNSKTAIYLAICERGSRFLNQKMARVLTRDITGLEMVEEMGQEYLNFIQLYPQYYNAFNFFENAISENKLIDSNLVDLCEKNGLEAMTYIVRALQIGMQDGTIKDTFDPKELAVIIWGGSKGIVQIAYMKEHRRHMKVLDEVSFSLESLVKGFIEIIGSGIKNDHRS
ncbi:MAG: TetR/AcrR family transcriptional regulator [Balneolaceae bacterium]